jgi:hypothetical protein
VDAEARERWVAKLRTGLPQTTGVLRRTAPGVVDPAGYCCLGVACETYIESDGRLHVEALGETITYDGHRTTLPPSVARWLGLSAAGHRPDGARWHVGGRTFDALADANDQGVSFADIADAIEAL